MVIRKNWFISKTIRDWANWSPVMEGFFFVIIGTLIQFLDKKKFWQFPLSDSLFLCFPLFSVHSFVPYLRLCANAYVPNYGYLFEENTSENKKYIYWEIDTHYYKQTACTTPFGVKAYASQSNPLHFWVAFDKNQNIHLTRGTNQWHICKISPITKVDYSFEFCKKPPVKTIKIFKARWKNSAREKKKSARENS